MSVQLQMRRLVGSGRGDRGDRADVSPAMFELLEGRRLLSGNVSATYDSPTNTLNIIGDNKANQIVVHHVPGGYQIVPVAGSGTTVNGSATPVVVLILPTAPVTAGPDSVELFTPAALAKINADMGNGADDITLDIPAVTGLSLDTTIATGNGDDKVSISNWTFFGKLSIDTGNGDDEVYISGGGGEVTVQGNLNVNTGHGDDELTFDAPLRVLGSTTLDGGNGFDVLTGRAFLITNPATLSILNFESVS
jgi:hypothetical protein